MTVGFLDSILSERFYSSVFVVIGIAIICFGLAKNKHFGESEERGKIIREKLLTLPENYYVLYYVKVPESNEGINHVVIGPTGIFSIITQKFNAKEDKDRLKLENENENLISTANNKKGHSGEILTSKFGLGNEEIKFESNNKIKQKSLKLSKELKEFLKENGIEEIDIHGLVGFVNKDVAIINIPLKNEDLFINELIHRITSSPIKLDTQTVHRCAVLLSQYSAKCSS